ncbi:protein STRICTOSIDINE SYNTHASE-LIKE 10-like isoform X2 [Magnolia sinica]|uniref:protein STRICTOSIDINE SYNTHASE-LIKE 10-like isoform X2 n=1 Tax=Magnolia sinica TaxID=86752 RepID=UPI002658B27C|nr:protein STRICTOSIDINE SYNTHASE-LIKE 10-like isoform X2 [Magnolia sinica]
MTMLAIFFIFVFFCFPSLSLSLPLDITIEPGRFQQLDLGGLVGPESIAFDPVGQGPYTGVSDGRVLKWQGAAHGWTEFAVTSPHRGNTLVIISGDRTGRLLKYDPRSKEVTMLLEGLVFPNGVAISKDSTFLLIVETTTQRILRFWLQGPKARALEFFAQLSRYPDNIKRNPRG